jgi:hypothetical protein
MLSGCEALSINLTQHADRDVTVLVADFAIALLWRLSKPALLMLDAATGIAKGKPSGSVAATRSKTTKLLRVAVHSQVAPTDDCL